MTFPLWYLLIPYAAILFFAMLFLFFNLFHLGRYGFESGKTYGIMAAYTIGFLLIIATSAILLLSYNWNLQVSPGDIFPYLGNNTASQFGL